MLIPRGPVEVPHEDEPREHVRCDHVRPGNDRDTGPVAQQQAGVERQFLGHQAEQHAEQQARRGSQHGDRPGHADAEQREHREVDDGIGRDQSERRGTDRLAGEGAGERRRRVEGPACDGVHHEEPERDHQPREEPADDAVGDQVVDGPLHRVSSSWVP